MTKIKDLRLKEQMSEEEKLAKATVDTIATEIAKLSRQVTALVGGRLNRKAIVVLLTASSGLSQSYVNMVLDAIMGLEDKYLNK